MGRLRCRISRATDRPRRLIAATMNGGTSQPNTPLHHRLLFITAVVAIASAGCRTAVNYPDPTGPRYAGAPAPGSDTVHAPAELKLVSFNLEFGRQVEQAIALLTSEPDLEDADVILLQEVDDSATRRIADALGLAYVYYPAVRSLRTTRDFGNAVLTRWPIVDDEKLILPHRALFSRMQRTATAVTLQIGSAEVRVYSAHLGTLLEVGPEARRNQLRTILDDARGYTHVVVGGDMNSHGIGGLAVARGYSWPTRDGPRTTTVGRWDHIFLRGMSSSAAEPAGTIENTGGASDHRPVWVRALLGAERRT